MKRKFLCIYFPNWAVNQVQRVLSPDTAHKGVLLTVVKNNQSIVARRCAVAKRLGIKEGTTLSLAKAFLPAATVLPFDVVGDFKKLYRTAVLHYSHTPLIGFDSQLIEGYKKNTLDMTPVTFYGIILDFTGTDKIYPDEKHLIKKINEYYLQIRIETRISLASTIGMAWAMSRYSPERISIFQPNDLSRILETLPVESLRLPLDITDALRSVGITTINLLEQIPRKNILERYGKGCLIRLDQVFGRVPERIVPLQMPHSWTAVREFDFPLADHDAIREIIVELVCEIFQKLREKNKIASRFDLYLVGRSDAYGYYQARREFSLFKAGADLKHVKEVIWPLVESLTITGPVEIVLLTARHTEVFNGQQKHFNKEEEKTLAKEELRNHLVSRFGYDKIKYTQFRESYIPEESFELRSITAKISGSSTSLLEGRPSVILTTPEEVSAIAALPDSPPAKIQWQKEELSITHGIGPERIETPWFNELQNQIEERDYFKVQDHTGRWLWIYRDNDNQRWYLQGMWI